MPIYLFFYFITLVIAINPAWSAFFPLSYSSNIPMPGKHSIRETDLQHVPRDVGYSPSSLISRGSQAWQTMVTSLFKVPLVDAWVVLSVTVILVYGIDHISFFLPKSKRCKI